MRFVMRKLWELKLQIHMIEKECAQLIDVIGHTLMVDLHLEGIITRLLFIYVCALRGYNYEIVVYLRVCTWRYNYEIVVYLRVCTWRI